MAPLDDVPSSRVGSLELSPLPLPEPHPPLSGKNFVFKLSSSPLLAALLSHSGWGELTPDVPAVVSTPGSLMGSLLGTGSSESNGVPSFSHYKQTFSPFWGARIAVFDFF